MSYLLPPYLYISLPAFKPLTVICRLLRHISKWLSASSAVVEAPAALSISTLGEWGLCVLRMNALTGCRLNEDYIVFRGGEHEAASAHLRGTLILCLSEPLTIKHLRLELTGMSRVWYVPAGLILAGSSLTQSAGTSRPPPPPEAASRGANVCSMIRRGDSVTRVREKLRFYPRATMNIHSTWCLRGPCPRVWRAL